MYIIIISIYFFVMILDTNTQIKSSLPTSEIYVQAQFILHTKEHKECLK